MGKECKASAHVLPDIECDRVDLIGYPSFAV